MPEILSRSPSEYFEVIRAKMNQMHRQLAEAFGGEDSEGYQAYIMCRGHKIDVQPPVQINFPWGISIGAHERLAQGLPRCAPICEGNRGSGSLARQREK